MNVKRLGIMVDENTVKQYALSEGISKTGKELTQTEKLMARYAAIMEQTATAQGDLARTIDSPVNRLRLLSTQFDQAKIAFGQAIQPLQAAVIPVLTSLAKAATVAAQALAYLMGSLGGFGGTGIFANAIAKKGAAVNDELADSLGDSADAYKKAGGAAKKASKDAKVGLKAFDEINKLTEETTKTGSGGGIDEIDVPDIEPANAYADAMEGISEKVKAVAEALAGFWEKIKGSLVGELIGKAWDGLKGLWENTLKPMGEWMLANPDIVIDTLLGIGVAVATWKIGTQTGWLGGIAGGLVKIGTAIAAHPGLFALALVAGGIVLVAGALTRAHNDMVNIENDSRFGSIAISLDTLRLAADKVTTPFSDAMKNLKSDFEALSNAGAKLEALSKYTAELLYGYKLMPEEFTAEKAAELIKSVQEEVDGQGSLLKDAQIKATMGLEALFSGTSVDGTEILKFNAENWEAVKKEAAALGKEYLDAVTDAAFDGVITDAEWTKVSNLQKKLLEMTTVATNPDVVIAQAQIRRMGMEFSGSTVTAETVTNFQKALNERWEELEGIMDSSGQSVIDYSMAVAIQANPDISDYELNKVRVIAEKALSEQKLTAQMEIEKVKIGSAFNEVKKAFKDVLDKSKPAVDAMGRDYMTEAMTWMLNNGWTSESINTRDGQRTLAGYATAMMEEGVKGAQIPDGATKVAMQGWLDTFKPDYTAWKVMEAEYKRLGKTVPTSLAQGIADYEAMLAVSGNVKQLGDYILTAATGSKVSLYGEGTTIAKNFAQGFIDGVNDKLAAVSAASKKLANAARSSLTKTLVMNSPSKITEQIGAYFGEGFAIGMGDTGDMIANSASSLANIATMLQGISEKVRLVGETIKKFWDGLKNSLLGNIVGAAWSALEGLWNNVLKPMGEWALRNPHTIGNMIGAIGLGFATWEIGKMIAAGPAATALGKGLLHIGAAIAAHPVIAIVAGVVAGIAMIAGSIKSNFENLKSIDLASRFGEVAISMQDLQTMAKQTSTPFLKATASLKTEYAAIAQAAAGIQRLALASSSIVFAYALAPEPMNDEKREQVKSQVQSLIDTAFATLSEAKAFSAGAIALTFGAEEGGNLIEIDSASWTTIENELKRLGGELDKAVADYVLSSDPTAEQAAAIVAYQQKIADLMLTATSADKAMAEVRLHRLKTGFGGDTLTADTVTNFSKALTEEKAAQEAEANRFIDEMMALQIQRARAAATIAGSPVEVVDATVASIKTDWDSKRKIELDKIELSIGEVYAQGVAGQINKAFKGELDEAQKAVDLYSKDWAKEAAIELYGEENWKEAIRQAGSEPYIADQIALMSEILMTKGLEGVKFPDKAARDNAKELLNMMQPTIDEWKAMEISLKAQGKQVPQWLSDALQDANMLKLISEATYKWKDMIEAGISGVDTKTHGRNFGQGFVDGINEKLAAVAAAGKKLANAARAAMTTTLEINSPSDITKEYGQYFGEGFAIGMGDTGNMIANSASSLANIAASSLTPGNIKSASMDVQSQNIVQQAVEAVLDRLQITLNVDGETWGRASVKHINNAQRMSGKVLLEM